jgi:hypothetical protein
MIEALAWALLIVPLLPLGALYVLRHHWHTPSLLLRLRLWTTVRDAALGLFIALLAANRLFGWGLSGPGLAIPFAIGMLLVSLPSGWWLVLYWRGSLTAQ